jgi:hypothetical protein
LTPYAAGLITGGLLTSIVDIGTWDMDSTAIVTIAHGITPSKIRGVESVMIISDEGLLYSFCDVLGMGSYVINGADIILARESSGRFNTVDFNGSANRGYIILQYLP